MAAKKKSPTDKTNAGTTRTLRDDAENKLLHSPKGSPAQKEQTLEALNHELQVHQIELEMQAEELRRAQIALEESRDKYIDLYEFAPVGYLTLTDKTLVTEANLSAATLLGADRNTLINHGFGVFITPEHLTTWDQYFKSVLNQREIQTCTLMLKRRDGLVFPARLEGVVTTSSGGAITIRIAISDITDIWQIGALRESEEHLKSIIEQSPFSIIVSSPDGRTVQVNHAFEELWGVTLEDLKDYNMLQDEQLTAQGIMPYIKLGFSGETTIFPPLQYDGIKTLGFGLKKWVQGRIYPVRDTGGTIHNVVVVHEDITERKKVEEALKESENRFKQIADNTGEWIWEVDADGLYTYSSPVVEKILGYRPDEIVGRMHFYDLFAPEVKEVLKKTALETFATKEHFKNFVNPILHKNGNRIFLETSGVPRLDEQDRLIGYRGADIDITKRIQAEEDLKESEQQYRSLFENANEGIIVVENDSKLFIHANPAICRMLGYQKEELLTMGVADIHPKDDLNHVFSEFRSLASGKTIIAKNISCIRKDGEIRIMDITSSNVVMHGRPFLVGLFTDITESRRAEEALVASEEVFREVFNNANDAIFLHEMLPGGLPGQYFKVNDIACMRLGYTREQLYTMTPLDIVSPEHRLIVPDIALKIKTEGCATFEAIHQRKDGSSFPVEVSTHLFMLQGRPVALSIARDITVRKKTEKTLLASEALYRSILNASPDDITITDMEGNISIVSPAALTIFGYEQEDELLGQSIVNFIVPEDRALSVANFGLMKQGILPGPGDYRAIHANGNTIDIEVNAEYIRDESGQPTSMVFIVRDVTTRKRTEALVTFLARMSDDAPASITVHDCEGKFLYANEETFRLHGFTREEFLAKNLHEIDVPESEHLIAERMQQIRDTGTAEFDTQHFRKDGSIIPLHVHVKTVDWEGRKVLLSIATDLTSQQRAEKALNESEEKYRSVVERANDGIVIIQEGRFAFSNTSFAKMSGYPADEIVDEDLLTFIPKERHVEVADILRRRITGEEMLVPYELDLIRKDGTTFTGEINAGVIEYLGRPADLVIIRDITYRKHAEELQKKTTELLNETQAITKLGGWEYDVVSGQMSWTDEVFRIHGVGHDFDPSNVKRNIGFYSPDDAPVIEQAFTRAIQEGEPYDLELKLVRADGRYIWVRTIGNPTMVSGRVVRVTGNIMDVTERKQMEMSLREAIQKLRLLTGITRHDIVNDLSVITLSLEMVRDSSDPEIMQKYIACAFEAGKTLENTIGFTREYENFGSISSGWFHLLPIINSARSDVSTGNITVYIEISSGLEVYADPIIRKVFTTLFENSIRHGGSLSTIRVSIEEQKDALIVTYEDDGVGIPSEEKEYIFDHGYGKHTGIGLFLAREILSITGLSIRETGVPGKGVRFEIQIPHNIWRVMPIRQV